MNWIVKIYIHYTHHSGLKMKQMAQYCPLWSSPFMKRSSPCNHIILIHDSTRPHNYSVHAGWISLASVLKPFLHIFKALLTWLDLAPLLLLRGRPPVTSLWKTPEWNLMHNTPTLLELGISTSIMVSCGEFFLRPIQRNFLVSYSSFVRYNNYWYFFFSPS